MAVPAPARLVLDVLTVDEHTEAVELVADVRSWARSTRRPGLVPRLRDAERVAGDLDVGMSAWLDAVETVLDVAADADMPDWGTPAALRRLVVAVIERDVFPETAVVRRRPRRSAAGLDARLAEVRREADARLTAAGTRALPRTPTRLGELDRRAQLSGWDLREQAA
jgi:hypothetical protein